MPLTVAKMAGKINLTTLQFAGEKVELSYRSGVLTGEWEAKWRGKPDGLYHQIEELVVKWDVVGDNGKTLGTKVADTKPLPIEFLLAVLRACAEDMRPNPGTSEPSGGSFEAE